jgi:hypothetical protein
VVRQIAQPAFDNGHEIVLEDPAVAKFGHVVPKDIIRVQLDKANMLVAVPLVQSNGDGINHDQEPDRFAEGFHCFREKSHPVRSRRLRMHLDQRDRALLFVHDQRIEACIGYFKDGDSSFLLYCTTSR